MIDALRNKESEIAVIGLGYVGLPVALSMARHFKVIGFDIQSARIQQLRSGIDPSGELSAEEFEGCAVRFTDRKEDLQDARFFIITVPTPIDEHQVPELSALFDACSTAGQQLKKGDIVLIESTVYPGCVEEECLPILERESGLKGGTDFGYGFSPERINPGDAQHGFRNILKIVSANNPEYLDTVAQVYGTVVEAGIYKAPSIKVAEAAKVIENAQRDLNIAFVNELSIIFDKMGLDTREVLDAAATKWNFVPFEPGLVGGHCIGVDPYYLVHKAKTLDYDPEVILSGRSINDRMPAYVAKKMIQSLIAADKIPQNSKVLVMGLTFKENVSDIRNSKVADLVRELTDFAVDVDVYDPVANAEDARRHYDINPLDRPQDGYDAVIVAVKHDEFESWTADQFLDIMNEHPILYDLKGLYDRENMKSMKYWRL